MMRKIFELICHIIMMVSAGATVGLLLNDALAEAWCCALIAAIAAHWWRTFRALERD